MEKHLLKCLDTVLFPLNSEDIENGERGEEKGKYS